MIMPVPVKPLAACNALEMPKSVSITRPSWSNMMLGRFAREGRVMGEKPGAPPAFAALPLASVLPFDEPLQALHQSFDAATRAHRAATGHIRAAGVAELAAVRERSVALKALHHGSCRTGHGRRRGGKNGRRPPGAPTIGDACGRNLLRVGAGGPGRIRLQERSAAAGIPRMHME